VGVEACPERRRFKKGLIRFERVLVNRVHVDRPRPFRYGRR
jgi:hypothetical protein